MKSILISLMAVAGLMAAGSVRAADVPEIPAAAKKFQCTTCHEIDKRRIGPSWMEISKFYNGKMDKSTSGRTVQEATGGKAVDEFLEEKISKGGHGNWGAQPMLANDNVYHQTSVAKQAEIKELVKFILDLDK
jgi:cytochrome c551/c552